MSSLRKIFKSFVKVFRRLSAASSGPGKSSRKSRRTLKTKLKKSTRSKSKTLKKSSGPRSVVKKKTPGTKKTPAGHAKLSSPPKTAKSSQKSKGKSRAVTGILVGEITHYFSRIQVVVIKITGKSLLAGDRICIRGKSQEFTQKVGSLQIESRDVKLGRKGDIVGMKVVQPAKEGDRVYKME